MYSLTALLPQDPKNDCREAKNYNHNREGTMKNSSFACYRTWKVFNSANICKMYNQCAVIKGVTHIMKIYLPCAVDVLEYHGEDR